MLNLLTSPAWSAPGALPSDKLPLPTTVPAALLVVLATQPDWMMRADLALIFWPDVAPSDALHNLRINLHRSRRLLAEWGQLDALQSDRVRLRLHLPTDLAELQAAQARADAQLLSAGGPGHYLAGWRLPNYAGFRQWCDDTAQKLQTEWLAAGQRFVRSVSQQVPFHETRASAFGDAFGGVSGGISGGTFGGPFRDTANATLHTPQADASGFLSPRLPGRQTELKRLLASPKAAVLLCGEPGAGKSTLLFTAYPRAPCLRGLEGLQAMPYRPLLDALRLHLGVLGRALREPSHALRPYRLDLARVLPELAPDEPLPPLDALTAQSRLVEALARAFEAVTPLLLVDDLQWCDSATVQWLAMLAHSGRLRWRATLRPRELSHDTAQTLKALTAAAQLEALDVLPLSRSSLEEICLNRWPALSFSADRLDSLLDLSGGNALVLCELLADDADVYDPSQPSRAASIALTNELRVLERLRPLVLRRLQALSVAARTAVDAAAVFAQWVPAQALWVAALALSADELNSIAAQKDPPAVNNLPELEIAVDAGLLRGRDGSWACRHDLIRRIVLDALSAERRLKLNQRAASWWAMQSDVDALTVAEHWKAAAEPQMALLWSHQAAEQLKARGSFDEARLLWREVMESSNDPALRLRSQLNLAACDLFDDLAGGEVALNAVLAQLNSVAEPLQRLQIEAAVLSALVDNRVFAGDLPAATLRAQRLHALLPKLMQKSTHKEAVIASEVLIELAMRQPDIPMAWSLLGRLRSLVPKLAPKQPSLLSFEGQIHWFGGQVQAAHDALARLLAQHPDYCRGITIENDLAVMLQALGRIAEAEVMAQRSLQSWAGVAHTETLSLLVMGLVQISAGRHAQADAALTQALSLARAQASRGFEAEALVRHARLWWQCGQFAAAQKALDRAAPLLAESPEPLSTSQLACMQVLCASAVGKPAPEAALLRLQGLVKRSEHPLVHIRWARVRNELASGSGDWNTAAEAAMEVADTARHAGLLEPLAEALLLQACAGLRLASGQKRGETSRQLMHAPYEPSYVTLAKQALTLSTAQGFADVRWRAAAWLQAHGAEFVDAEAGAVVGAHAGAYAVANLSYEVQAAQALQVLSGPGPSVLFDAVAAERREPRWGV